MIFFFFNDTATTEIYTLSLHDALPIWTQHEPASRLAVRSRKFGQQRLVAGFSPGKSTGWFGSVITRQIRRESNRGGSPDRKSTRLNSSHLVISYAVFCLKKKNRLCSGY